jgi:oxygen-independent coproporphyrinogen-3 oxidase
MLAAHGFEQYEVSAYARAGSQCRHNLNYWQFGDYVGLGAGAHGKLTAALPDRILRTEKPKQPRDYQSKVRESRARGIEAVGERRHIAVADLPFEFMLNALRLNAGFAAGDFERRTGLPLSGIAPALERAGERGLLERSGERWRPTELGRKFLNDLQASFLP